MITEAGLAHEIGLSRTPGARGAAPARGRGPGRPSSPGAARWSTPSRSTTSRTSSRPGCWSRTTPRPRPSPHRATLLPRLEAAHARRCAATGASTTPPRSPRPTGVFHELIVDAADNAVLSSIYRMLRERQTLFTSVMMRGRTDRMQAAIDEHDRILEALRGDDAAAFCAAVNDHLQWSIALARESPLSQPARSREPRRRPAPSVVCGDRRSAVYFLAIFHRSSLGVAGLAAAERFDITASQLSTFTVLQLLVYAAMQIPVGVLLDRFGPQRLLFAGAVLMTGAQLGFAFTGTYAGALAARVLRRHGRRDGVHQRAAADRVVVPADAQPAAHRVHRDDRPVRRAGRRRTPLRARCRRTAGPRRSLASASVGVRARPAHVLLVRDVPPGRRRRPARQGRPHRRARPAGWPGATPAPGSGCGRTSPRSSPPT